MKKLTCMALVLCVVLIAACRNGEEPRLKNEISEVTQQMAKTEQRIAASEQTILSLQNQARQIVEEINARKREVVGYMSEHKMAIGCMAAAGYSLGKDNLFSKEVNEFIAIGALLCTLAVLMDEKFQQEIISVIKELEQADADVKKQQSQLAAINAKISTEKNILLAEKTALDGLSEKHRNLQTQLAARS